MISRAIFAGLAPSFFAPMASAEVDAFHPGMFVMRAADYDWETDRLTPDAPPLELTRSLFSEVETCEAVQ